MNEFAFHGELHWHDGLQDFEALSLRMAHLRWVPSVTAPASLIASSESVPAPVWGCSAFDLGVRVDRARLPRRDDPDSESLRCRLGAALLGARSATPRRSLRPVKSVPADPLATRSFGSPEGRWLTMFARVR